MHVARYYNNYTKLFMYRNTFTAVRIARKASLKLKCYQ
jgi:hypothetical protein